MNQSYSVNPIIKPTITDKQMLSNALPTINNTALALEPSQSVPNAPMQYFGFGYDYRVYIIIALVIIIVALATYIIYNKEPEVAPMQNNGRERQNLSRSAPVADNNCGETLGDKKALIKERLRRANLQPIDVKTTEPVSGERKLGEPSIVENLNTMKDIKIIKMDAPESISESIVELTNVDTVDADENE